MKNDVDELLQRAKGGDSAAFARLLTAVEHLGSACLRHKELQNPSRAAFRVGITGPPGSGKSTLIGEVLKQLSSHDLKIGVLAVDPSSPFSQGAILGDRIRFIQESDTEKLFIRSLGTRGSLGGLSSSAYLMLRAFDACGFDLVIIETVGVGQVEVEIMNVADLVCLVLVPESGDSIQAMKAGVMEIADLFIVNKSDRPGADSIKREIEAHLHIDDEVRGQRSQLAIEQRELMTSAIKNQGVNEVCKTILDVQKNVDILANRADPKKIRAEGFALLRFKIESQARQELGNVESQRDLNLRLNN